MPVRLCSCHAFEIWHFEPQHTFDARRLKQNLLEITRLQHVKILVLYCMTSELAFLCPYPRVLC